MPLGGLINVRNLTLEDHTWRTGGGATRLGSTLGATVTGLAALDFWPDTATQRTLVYGDDGALYKDNGAGGAWVTLASGLTTSGAIPMIYEAGAEAAGRNRKAIFPDRANSSRVLSGDGATAAAIASPAADWAGTNQPGFGVQHQSFNWMGGNANAPHTIYRSTAADHEDFLTSPYTLRIFPGEGERLSAGLSYKGVLLLWKYGRSGGVYAVDTSDANSANWRVIKVGTAGAAGPLCVVAMEDDVAWVAPDGTWHLISATTATGSVRAEDIAARKLGAFHRENINLARLDRAQMVYYAHKQEVQLACSAIGATAKNRRLHLDLNRRTEVGERWVWWDRDRNEAMFLRKRDEIHIPAMVDNVGQVWELDRTGRDAAGSGYTFEVFMADTDFGQVVPGWQGRYKNLRFIQLEYDGRTSSTVTVEVYGDGALLQTLSLALTASGPTLPVALPFTLGIEGLALTRRRRLTGRARRIAIRLSDATVSEDVSIARILLAMEVGE